MTGAYRTVDPDGISDLCNKGEHLDCPRCPRCFCHPRAGVRRREQLPQTAMRGATHTPTPAA